MRWADFLSFLLLIVMKRLLLGFVFLLMLTPSMASHIVGGEFELLWISGNSYRLRLIYYFDLGSNPGRNPQFEEPIIQVSIFQKSNHSRMQDERLSFVLRERVEYSQMHCASTEIITDRIIYEKIIVLSAATYTHPGGYYVSWERCCRNYGINNIFSEDPNLGMIYAGQTFYLEFPAVVRNGQPFINNSPRLFPPLNDFACPGIPYYVDFAGIDDDGDSLVYKLVTPLSTISQDAIPQQSGQFPLGQTRSGPYPNVTWRPGFGLNNIVNGISNLKITQDGFLTVTPSPVGLYAFAVQCEEFRDGVKIGEIIRDFQMLTVELGGCPVPDFPSIVGRKSGDPVFQPGKTLHVTLENDEDRCIEVSITDPSSLRADELNQENITIKAFALNFKKTLLNQIQLSGTSGIINNGGSAVFEICFPQCSFTQNVPIKVAIVVSDDACALPLTDTLYVHATIEPPPNQVPQMGSGDEIITSVNEGDFFSRLLSATDADGDVLDYRLVPVGFSLQEFGMSFSVPLTGQGTGAVSGTLNWDPKCDVYDFTQKDNFELYFIADDRDACLFKHADTTRLDLTVFDFDQITPPMIDNTLDNFADTLEVTMKMYGDPFVLNVSGTDADNTNILLRGNGVGFNAASYGAVFPRDFDQGAVASEFRWELHCDSIDLERQDIFRFNLMVVDSLNKCGFYKADTLHLVVTIEPPDEEKFTPPNVFSPNSDAKNAFFAMVSYNEDTGEFTNILPEDNCYGEFLSIRIYDRWGKRVFESSNRDFRWYGEDVPVGVYYYLLSYSNRNYKGIVSLRL